MHASVVSCSAGLVGRHARWDGGGQVRVGVGVVGGVVRCCWFTGRDFSGCATAAELEMPHGFLKLTTAIGTAEATEAGEICAAKGSSFFRSAFTF